MSNIRKAFERDKTCVTFVTCGDPDLDTTSAVIHTAVKNGTNLLILGIPFSDATAEGPLIQESYLRALQSGITTERIFTFVKDISHDIHIPLVFMTYANVVFSYGVERFISSCSKIGIDGLILPDLPFEEKEEFHPVCKQYDIDLISVVASASEKRISMISQVAEGFIYVIPGTDLSEHRSKIKTDIGSIIQTIRKNTDIPCVADLSCLVSEQEKNMSGKMDGVILKSDIIELIGKYGRDASEHIGFYIKSITEGFKGMRQ